MVSTDKEKALAIECKFQDVAGTAEEKLHFAIKDLELSEEICEKILLEKLQDLIVRVGKKFPWWSKAPEPIRDVVVELCYQLGVTGFSRFKKTIDHLENRRYAKAATEMLDSKWARSDSPNRALAMSKIVKEQE